MGLDVKERPRKLVGAFPVACEDALHRVAALANEIYCLRVPHSLGGVGRFYIDFRQIPDNGVLSILREYAVC